MLGMGGKHLDSTQSALYLLLDILYCQKTLFSNISLYIFWRYLSKSWEIKLNAVFYNLILKQNIWFINVVVILFTFELNWIYMI